jgi:hypothetical protein
MPKEILIAIAIVIPIVIGSYFIFFYAPSQPQKGLDKELLEKLDVLRFTNINPNDSISSPLYIEGLVKQEWFSNNEFPVKLLDKEGNLIAETNAFVGIDQDSNGFFPFSSLLNFSFLRTGEGVLVFQRSGVQGYLGNDNERKIFVTVQESIERIKLYYYNSNLDKDESGNALYSKEGLVAVERIVPFSNDLIKDAINLLLKGILSPEEKNQGITTDFPLEGLSLNDLYFDENRNLFLVFPNYEFGLDSKRMENLRLQIEATALQFPDVTAVFVKPDDLF